MSHGVRDIQFAPRTASRGTLSVSPPGRICTPNSLRDGGICQLRCSPAARRTGTASRVDSVEEQVIRRITHHEVHRAPAEQIVDRPAADNHRLRQWAERGPDRSVAGLRTLYDTTVGDWDGHTGRPLEMDA